MRVSRASAARHRSHAEARRRGAGQAVLVHEDLSRRRGSRQTPSARHASRRGRRYACACFHPCAHAGTQACCTSILRTTAAGAQSQVWHAVPSRTMTLPQHYIMSASSDIIIIAINISTSLILMLMLTLTLSGAPAAGRGLRSRGSRTCRGRAAAPRSPPAHIQYYNII